MTRNTLIFLLTLVLVSAAAANEIVIQSDDNQQYLTFVANDPVKIAGYNIQLNYSADTRILSVETLEPYTGVFKIDNDEGWTRIVGFTGSNRHSARLAGFTYAGKGDFSVIVYELYDSDLNDVAVSNTIGTKYSATDSPTPTIPEYQPNVGYISPTRVENGPNPITGDESAKLPAAADPTSVYPSEPITSGIPSSSHAYVEERVTPTLTVSPVITTQSAYSQTTPKSPLNTMLAISAMIAAAFYFASIRKDI